MGGISATGGSIIPGDTPSSPTPGLLIDTGAMSLVANGSGTNTTVTVVLDGTTAGNGTGNYSQVQVAGTIDLSGATLSASLGPDFVDTPGSKYTILDNTGTTAISGTFSGQAEGSTVMISNVPFEITYVGGANSDSVVLTELYASTTTVTFTPSAPVYGQTVALTATVTGPSGSPTPTGSVQFFNGTTSLGSAIALSGGSATMDVSSLAVGSNSITATYSGDTSFASGTSPAVTVPVTQASSSTTITPSTTTPVFNQEVELTATVSAVSPEPARRPER